MKNPYTIISVILFLLMSCSKEEALKSRIASIIKDKNALVGVAVVTDKEEVLVVNDTLPFPTMSVFKFHLALAVLDHMNGNNIPLETEIHVRSEELLPNTYSPLRDEKSNVDFDISLEELLQYTVAQSDNNACDILFRYVGGTEVVNDYIKSLGAKNVSIKATEEEMHKGFEYCYLNTATPSSTTHLLRIFETTSLFADVYKDFLIRTMLATSTGMNKLKAQLPSNILVGHKTGSSDRNAQGMKAGDNDAGFVYLPDGRKYYIAVFVMNSMESDDDNALIISDISKAVYDYFLLLSEENVD